MEFDDYQELCGQALQGRHVLLVLPPDAPERRLRVVVVVDVRDVMSTIAL